MAEQYEVIGTRESQDMTLDGRVLDVVEVTFVVKSSGTSGTVQVPKDKFDPEVVDAFVSEYVARIEAVEAL